MLMFNLLKSSIFNVDTGSPLGKVNVAIVEEITFNGIVKLPTLIVSP